MKIAKNNDFTQTQKNLIFSENVNIYLSHEVVVCRR